MDFRMNLDAYLARIGVSHPVKSDLDGLRAVHRAHALSLAFEDLDVQLAVPLTRDPARAYDKIVNRRRGGWCYEMNGLFGWALEEIGFKVSRLAGAVMREAAGDAVIGNHLLLLVDIDGAPWIADVGFGGGLVDPVPLRVGAVDANPLGCRLDAIDGGWWRFTEDARMGGMSYDFNPAVDDEALLEKQCRFLQTDAASPFVQNAVAQRWIGEAHYSLRGRVLRILTPREEKKSIVATADAYVETLRETFGVDLPEAARLWPAICIRHEEVFGMEKAI